MNLQQLLAKLKAYPLAVILLLVTVVLGGWAYYRSGTLDDLYGQLDTVTAQNDLISKNIKDGLDLKGQLDQLTAALDQFKPGLINPSAVIPNQQYFYDFEQSTGVHILDPEETGTMAGKDSSQPSVTSFKMGATGSWDTVIGFLNALQTGPHYLRFQAFSIQKSEQTRSTTGVVQPVSVNLVVDVLGQ